MKTTVFLIALLVMSLFIGPSAFAGRQWYFQRVETSWGEPLGGGNTAIGMRSGHTWPVVMTEESAAAMVPGGWVRSSEGIHSGGHIDAATSHDGQSMIFAGTDGQIKTFGPSGWSQTFVPARPWHHESRNSVAYTQQDNAAILYRSAQTAQITLSTQSNGGWSSSSLNRYAEGFALTYDSYDQANVVLSEGGMLVYGTKGVLTNNTWNFSESIPQPLRIGDVLDLELTANDIPYVAYTDEVGYLSYATYNRIQGQWETGILDATMNPSSNFCMASDQQGGIGVAYVTEADGITRLGFAYTNGNGGWNTDLLPNELFDEFGNPIDMIDIASDLSIGLVFDGENNPVISFSGHGETWIAYDPVPEPATCLLLLFGGITALRSRKKA